MNKHLPVFLSIIVILSNFEKCFSNNNHKIAGTSWVCLQTDLLGDSLIEKIFYTFLAFDANRCILFKPVSSILQCEIR